MTPHLIGRRSRRPLARRVWTMRLMAMAMTLLVCEVALQVASHASSRVRRALTPAYVLESNAAEAPPVVFGNPAVGYRGNPDHPALDRNGFHNSEVPIQAVVIAIGDSQTFGPIGRPEHRMASAL